MATPTHKPKTDQKTMQFGKAIEEAREQAGYTQRQLAKSLNITQPQISSLEQEKRNISLEQLFNLATQLNTLGAEFIKPHFLESTQFEVRLLNIGDSANFEYLKSLEQRGRLVVFSNFPSAIYQRTTDNPNLTAGRTARYNDFLSQRAGKTSEYYQISSLFEFAFSPFSTFSLEDKQAILNNCIKMFENRYHSLHFFSGEKLLNVFSNIELIELVKDSNKHVIIMNSPLSRELYFEINNRKIYHTIREFFFGNQKLTVIKTECAILILKQLQEFLSQTPSYTSNSLQETVHRFIHAVPQSCQNELLKTMEKCFIMKNFLPK